MGIMNCCVAGNCAAPGPIGIGPYGVMAGMAGMWPFGIEDGFEGVALGAGVMLTWFGSMRSSPVGSIDCFLRFDACFWTRLLAEEDLVGLAGAPSPLELSGSFLISADALFEDPQPHFCLRGMAAVTAAQEHERDDGCGHELSGRPGFRTGTMSRSFACVHLVERWPRMQGSL